MTEIEDKPTKSMTTGEADAYRQGLRHTLSFIQNEIEYFEFGPYPEEDIRLVTNSLNIIQANINTVLTMSLDHG